MKRKKLTVYDYLKCKGKRQLSVLFVHSAEEARAAEEAGIDAPYSCRGGACATCIGKLKSGTVELEQNYILTDSEIEEGLIITCQAFPTSENIYVDADDI